MTQLQSHWYVGNTFVSDHTATIFSFTFTYPLLKLFKVWHTADWDKFLKKVQETTLDLYQLDPPSYIDEAANNLYNTMKKTLGTLVSMIKPGHRGLKVLWTLHLYKDHKQLKCPCNLSRKDYTNYTINRHWLRARNHWWKLVRKTMIHFGCHLFLTRNHETIWKGIANSRSEHMRTVHSLNGHIKFQEKFIVLNALSSWNLHPSQNQ